MGADQKGAGNVGEKNVGKVGDILGRGDVLQFRRRAILGADLFRVVQTRVHHLHIEGRSRHGGSGEGSPLTSHALGIQGIILIDSVILVIVDTDPVAFGPGETQLRLPVFILSRRKRHPGLQLVRQRGRDAYLFRLRNDGILFLCT